MWNIKKKSGRIRQENKKRKSKELDCFKSSDQFLSETLIPYYMCRRRRHYPNIRERWCDNGPNKMVLLVFLSFLSIIFVTFFSFSNYSYFHLKKKREKNMLGNVLVANLYIVVYSLPFWYFIRILDTYL